MGRCVVRVPACVNPGWGRGGQGGGHYLGVPPEGPGMRGLRLDPRLELPEVSGDLGLDSLMRESGRCGVWTTLEFCRQWRSFGNSVSPSYLLVA